MTPSEVSLLQIPEIPMKNILEYLDFPSILVLRKVCHDLRNFIDDTKPASHITEIDVSVYPQWIRFSMYFELIAAGTKRRVMTDIDYEKKEEGCFIYRLKEGNSKKKMMGNEDFVTLFCKDFDIILRHQKTVLKNVEISLHSSNTTVMEKVLESVSKSLKSLKHPLQVKSLCFKVNNHNEILSILPYIDPKSLEIIDIYQLEKESMHVMICNEICELEQWKQAKSLVIEGFQLPDLFRNFNHFSSINFGSREFSIEEITLLKEMFLRSSTLNIIQFHYDHCQKALLQQQLSETFGQPFLGNYQDKYWLFKTSDTNQFLRIQNFQYTIEFSRIEQSDVPQNAIILN